MEEWRELMMLSNDFAFFFSAMEKGTTNVFFSPSCDQHLLQKKSSLPIFFLKLFFIALQKRNTFELLHFCNNLLKLLEIYLFFVHVKFHPSFFFSIPQLCFSAYVAFPFPFLSTLP